MFIYIHTIHLFSLCRIFAHISYIDVNLRISIQLILHWQPLQVVFCTALICTYALQYTLLRYALWFKDFTCRMVAGVDFGNRLCVCVSHLEIQVLQQNLAIWFDMSILFYVFRGFKRSLTSQTSLDITCNIPSHWKERLWSLVGCELVYRVDSSVNHGDEWSWGLNGMRVSYFSIQEPTGKCGTVYHETSWWMYLSIMDSI